MSNHNFEDRFFKTRRILELTIFFFLAFSLLSFSFALEPIEKKITNLDPIVNRNSILQISNPTLISKPIVEYRPTITANIIEESRNAKKGNYNLVGETIYKLPFENSIIKDSEQFLINEGEGLDINLSNYIDEKYLNSGLGYSWVIIQNINNFCELQKKSKDYFLSCDFPIGTFGQKIINLRFNRPFNNYEELSFGVNILNIPKLKSQYSGQGYIDENVLPLIDNNFYIDNYIDFGIDDINFRIIPISALKLKSLTDYCSYDDSYNITCSNIPNSEVGKTFDYNELAIEGPNNFVLSVPFKFTVIPGNLAPEDIGNLGKGETIIGNSFLKTFDLSLLFEDPENDTLTYACSSLAKNVNDDQISKIGNECIVSFNETGFIDLNFSATDTSNNMAYKIYRVALLNESDIEFVFDDYNQDSFKVVDTLAFDLPLKLKGLNFDVYDLNISTNNFSNNTESFVFDLLKNETKEFMFSDLVSNNPKEYKITPIINSVPFTESQITVLAIANNAESLAEYFEIYPNILGDYKYINDLPANNYVPNGVKFVLPFAVENHLDVDLELEGCVSVGGASKVYSNSNGDYLASNLLCNNYTFLAKEKEIIENIVSLEACSVCQNDFRKVTFNLKKESVSLDENYMTIEVYNYAYNPNYNYLNVLISSIFTENTEKGSYDPFMTNKTYEVITYLSNSSVYEFLDINVCQFTAKYYNGNTENTGIENNYGKLLSPYCYNIPSVKYFKAGASGNEVQIPNFSFEIFDNLTLEDEFFVIRFGYYRNEGFEYDSDLWGQIISDIFNFGG